MNKLRRYQSRDLLSQLHNDFNRLLEPFHHHQELSWPEGSTSNWAPNIDVKEDDKQYMIHADIPGVKAADIHVHMDNGILTIKGEKQSETKEEKENYLRVERSTGSFIRQLTLPESVDPANIKATCSDGVLEITLPKTSHLGGRKIEVTEK